MRQYDKFFIDGTWVDPIGKESISVRSASTEEIIGQVPSGTGEDALKAIAAARRAFDGHWGETSRDERVEWLQKIAAALTERMGEIAETISQEVGMPIGMATAVQAGLPIATTNGLMEALKSVELEKTVGNSLVVKEPIGVVAAITPWNFPLHQILLKVAPAIASGCTVIVKPSSDAPLNAFLFAEICEAIGLPNGVVNIVSGPGAQVGEALATHPDVDMLSLTGSTAAGRRVMTLGAQTIKRVCLELGGKSANIILDDADIAKAVKGGVNNAMLNSGQTCSAWTRMVVPRARQDEILQLASDTMDGLEVGMSDNASAKLGPLISANQRSTVEGYIEKGKNEGARLVRGGGRFAKFKTGYFVEPTLFGDVDNKMAIAQEEIFGPVLSVIPYDSEDEAVRIANDTIYGLAGGVWSGDKDRAMAVARKIRAGQVDINGGGYNPMAPFGGYKQSGLGREAGEFGLDDFFEIKSLQM
jgi:betaine-aldehyde dehydrogenase